MIGFILVVAATAGVWYFEAKTGWFRAKIEAARNQFDDLLG